MVSGHVFLFALLVPNMAKTYFSGYEISNSLNILYPSQLSAESLTQLTLKVIKY